MGGPLSHRRSLLSPRRRRETAASIVDMLLIKSRIALTPDGPRAAPANRTSRASNSSVFVRPVSVPFTSRSAITRAKVERDPSDSVFLSELHVQPSDSSQKSTAIPKTIPSVWIAKVCSYQQKSADPIHRARWERARQLGSPFSKRRISVTHRKSLRGQTVGRNGCRQCGEIVEVEHPRFKGAADEVFGSEIAMRSAPMPLMAIKLNRKSYQGVAPSAALSPKNPLDSR